MFLLLASSWLAPGLVRFPVAATSICLNVGQNLLGRAWAEIEQCFAFSMLLGSSTGALSCKTDAGGRGNFLTPVPTVHTYGAGKEYALVQKPRSFAIGDRSSDCPPGRLIPQCPLSGDSLLQLLSLPFKRTACVGNRSEGDRTSLHSQDCLLSGQSQPLCCLASRACRVSQPGAGVSTAAIHLVDQKKAWNLLMRAGRVQRLRSAVARVSASLLAGGFTTVPSSSFHGFHGFGSSFGERPPHEAHSRPK